MADNSKPPANTFTNRADQLDDQFEEDLSLPQDDGRSNIVIQPEPKPSNLDALNLKIYNYEGVIYESNVVKSISSYNELGPIDILPQHENFISVLKGNINEDSLIVRLDSGEERKFVMENAVIRVFANNVEIFMVINTDSTLEDLAKSFNSPNANLNVV